MDAVVYVSKPRKQINGSLFYCFEYYAFLKQFNKDLKFIFVWGLSPRIKWGDEPNIEFFKEIWKDKYNFDHSILDDIITMSPVQYMMADVKNVLMLDVHSYIMIKDFLGKMNKLFLYSNKPTGEEYLNKDPRTTFYGWYDNYQFYNIKTRLKLYKEIHKTFEVRGDKTYISSPNGDNLAIAQQLGLDLDTVYLKENNTHFSGLFERINKIIYWHCGNNDANNRIIIESCIHNIPIEIHCNGYLDDSVYDRKQLLEQNKAEEFYLTDNDIMVRDFLEACRQE